MCDAETREFLRVLPKCEHHMHLEGSLEPSLLFSLAAKNNIALPSTSVDAAFASPSALLDRYRRFTSLDDFLHYYFIGMSVLQTADDFEALAYAYFSRAAADGVAHAEVFFDPQAHTARGVPYATLTAGFQRARTRAQADFHLTSELIVCMLRHLPVADGARMYHDDALPDLLDGTVAGIGLSSTERGFPPSLYAEVYADAARRGIKRTMHAGEEAGVAYMREALEVCRVQRVDHGIKLLDDPEVLGAYVDARVMVTVCPLSNVELRCVRAVADLPLREYIDHGVRFSINSDDPAYFGGYVLDNYVAVQEAFDLSRAEWEGIVRNGIEGSWCGDHRKAELLETLREVMVRYAR